MTTKCGIIINRIDPNTPPIFVGNWVFDEMPDESNPKSLEAVERKLPGAGRYLVIGVRLGLVTDSVHAFSWVITLPSAPRYTWELT